MPGERYTPIRTVDELLTLDQDEILAGYRSTRSGDPEPGPNRGRAFWHGWRTRMMDLGEIPIDETHRQLVREWLARAQAHC